MHSVMQHEAAELDAERLRLRIEALGHDPLTASPRVTDCEITIEPDGDELQWDCSITFQGRAVPEDIAHEIIYQLNRLAEDAERRCLGE